MPKELTLNHYLIAAMIAVYLIMSVRVALRMGASGRSFWKWLLITVFCTGVPAMIVLGRGRRPRRQGVAAGGGNRRGAGDGPPLRCPHCNRPVARDEIDSTSGVGVCPHCGMPMDGDTRIA